MQEEVQAGFVLPVLSQVGQAKPLDVFVLADEPVVGLGLVGQDILTREVLEK